MGPPGFLAISGYSYFQVNSPLPRRFPTLCWSPSTWSLVLFFFQCTLTPLQSWCYPSLSVNDYLYANYSQTVFSPKLSSEITPMRPSSLEYPNGTSNTYSKQNSGTLSQAMRTFGYPPSTHFPFLTAAVPAFLQALTPHTLALSGLPEADPTLIHNSRGRQWLT